MKHPDTDCDCDAAAVGASVALSVCGKIAIMKVSTLSAVCDGDMIRRVEPKVLQDQSRS